MYHILMFVDISGSGYEWIRNLTVTEISQLTSNTHEHFACALLVLVLNKLFLLLFNVS